MQVNFYREITCSSAYVYDCLQMIVPYVTYDFKAFVLNSCVASFKNMVSSYTYFTQIKLNMITCLLVPILVDIVLV